MEITDEIISEMDGFIPEENTGRPKKFLPIEKWNNFKCTRCNQVSDMFTCKSVGGFLQCKHCGKLN